MKRLKNIYCSLIFALRVRRYAPFQQGSWLQTGTTLIPQSYTRKDGENPEHHLGPVFKIKIIFVIYILLVKQR